jgi:hypothetical protein
MEDESAAYQPETDAWFKEGDEHGRREAGEDNDRSAPRHAPGTRGHLRRARTPQYFTLEEIAGNVNADEEPCLKHHRGRCETGPRNLFGRER